MYKEILELEKFCEKIGIETHKEELFDGYVLKFNNGSDVIQHGGSYGHNTGCVEFGYTGVESRDFCATPLEKAKDFVHKYKRKLNKSL